MPNLNHTLSDTSNTALKTAPKAGLDWWTRSASALLVLLIILSVFLIILDHKTERESGVIGSYDVIQK